MDTKNTIWDSSQHLWSLLPLSEGVFWLLICAVMMSLCIKQVILILTHSSLPYCTHLKLAARLRVSRTIPLFTFCACVACMRRPILLTLSYCSSLYTFCSLGCFLVFVLNFFSSHYIFSKQIICDIKLQEIYSI